MRSNHSKRTFFNFGSLSDMFVNVQSSYFCVRVFLFFNKSNKNLDPAKKKRKILRGLGSFMALFWDLSIEPVLVNFF
jgi:hypothetical protein